MWKLPKILITGYRCVILYILLNFLFYSLFILSIALFFLASNLKLNILDLSDGDEVDTVDCIILIIIFFYISGSCGSCGYELNLNSCNRNISAIDSKYGKFMKRGVISFFSIDESRFTQVNKLQLLPYFTSKSSWRLFRRRTKLLCRNCGNYIGTVSPFHLVKSNSEAWDGISACRTYDIKIGSLRPMSSEESSVFL